MNEAILIVGGVMIAFGLGVIALNYYQEHKPHTH